MPQREASEESFEIKAMKKHSQNHAHQRFRKDSEEVSAYYRALRKRRYERREPLKGIRWRRWTHSIVMFLLAGNRLLLRQKLTLLRDRSVCTKRPTIYACTHVGRYDIEIALQLIRRSTWFFMGDPGPVYRRFDGLVLWLNGVIYMDTAYTEDRHIGKETCVRLLEQGGNLLIYPEGAWNISENQVVMPLFHGTAEMAIRAGAEIVPIAVEQRGKHYYANIGRNIRTDGYRIERKQELTEKLREALCTLKWEIWEAFPITKRGTLPADAGKRFLESIMSESENGYTVEEIERTRYHVKNLCPPEDAFAFFKKLTPRRENAFLFRGNERWMR